MSVACERAARRVDEARSRRNVRCFERGRRSEQGWLQRNGSRRGCSGGTIPSLITTTSASQYTCKRSQPDVQRSRIPSSELPTHPLQPCYVPERRLAPRRRFLARNLEPRPQVLLPINVLEQAPDRGTSGKVVLVEYGQFGRVDQGSQPAKMVSSSHANSEMKNARPVYHHRLPNDCDAESCARVSEAKKVVESVLRELLRDADRGAVRADGDGCARRRDQLFDLEVRENHS